MAEGYFITGTDTGVGKTLVASALLHAYSASGKRCVGMKPVAAGCDPLAEGMRCEDVERLRMAGNVVAPQHLVSPFALEAAIAPSIAATQAGVTIDLGVIRNAYQELQKLAEWVIVEGVGGFCVPLNAAEDTADMAVMLGLPLILVVGMRLGCLNHALLTVEAARARGLHITGWVANQIDPVMKAFDENLQALRERLGCPLLGVLPWQPQPLVSEVAARLDLALLES